MYHLENLKLFMWLIFLLDNTALYLVCIYIIAFGNPCYNIVFFISS